MGLVSADDVARVSELHDAVQHQLRRGHEIRATLEGRPWLGPCPRSSWHDAIVSSRLLSTQMKICLRCRVTNYQQCGCHVDARLRTIENVAEWIIVVAGPRRHGGARQAARREDDVSGEYADARLRSLLSLVASPCAWCSATSTSHTHRSRTP